MTYQLIHGSAHDIPLFPESFRMTRKWAMPTADTFSCPPMGEFVKKYLAQSTVSVDPFARNKRWATYTNDLNPDTAAEHHMDALEFLSMLYDRGIKANLVIFDPPYSFNQMMEVYAGIGRKISGQEAQRFYGDMRDAIDRLVLAGGVVLSFGWNSIGMGKERGYRIEEILLVCHGRAHNDTICTADRKMGHQSGLFDMELAL